MWVGSTWPLSHIWSLVLAHASYICMRMLFAPGLAAMFLHCAVILIVHTLYFSSTFWPFVDYFTAKVIYLFTAVIFYITVYILLCLHLFIIILYVIFVEYIIYFISFIFQFHRPPFAPLWIIFSAYVISLFTAFSLYIMVYIFYCVCICLFIIFRK